MHDLTMTHALGGAAPQVDVIGTLTISEHPGLALASVAARLGQETACANGLKSLLGQYPPGPGQAVLHDPEAAFWMGPDQWMVGAPADTHEDLADQLKARLGNAASVTEQSGGWVVFDVVGSAMPDMCELLCAVPIRRMKAGAAQRTMIHQLGCFVLRRTDADHIRILGPRASAQSLHHALITAAKSVA